ncbi:biopolymer transporter ExbD [candidate division FCPU426 bacterium]|nr:biopolymer transporter ExbD [candidate division FCPU426 bacterium]
MKLKNGHRLQSIIPVASMSDIAFLLLIFMLLSSILAPQPPLRIDPPKVPNTAEVKEEQGLRIYVNAAGLAGINDTLGRLDDLENLLPGIACPEERVFLYADSGCEYEKIDRVLAALKAKAFRHVTLICRETPGGGPLE